MTKPTVANHRTQTRMYLEEAAANKFTDADCDTALKQSLAVLSGYVFRQSKVTVTGINTTDTIIDLTSLAPAEAVTEIVPTGSSTSITDFRPRAGFLVLKSAIGATSADVYWRGCYTHDGTNTDWYPDQYFGAVCMLAAGILMLGRERNMAETDAVKSAAFLQPAVRLFENAINIMANRTATPTSTSYQSKTL